MGIAKGRERKKEEKKRKKRTERWWRRERGKEKYKYKKMWLIGKIRVVMVRE